MENKVFRFKTNINCGGCVASVKLHLENVAGVSDWKVDTTNKDKILTVESAGITEAEILDIIKKAGFNAAPIA